MAFIVIFFIALIIGGVILSAFAANKRQEAFRTLANSLGMLYFPGRDHSYDEQYPFLKKLCQGRNRYAYNIIQGRYREHPVFVFDYHYETRSTDSKGRRKTNHHYFSFFILKFDKDFPELVIAREGWFSKIAQWFGYGDIDFESAEFSRKFIVRSPDKKFAYDICHSQMIEYMLANEDLSIEIEHNCLTLFFSWPLKPEQIPPNLDRIVQLRNMFPNYLMDA